MSEYRTGKGLMISTLLAWFNVIKDLTGIRVTEHAHMWAHMLTHTQSMEANRNAMLLMVNYL